MARLKPAKTTKEVNGLTLASLRVAYNQMAENYTNLIEGRTCLCHKCNNFKASTGFYGDTSYLSGLFPICKECLLNMATDYDKVNDVYVDNVDKTKQVFRMMNLPFIQRIYDDGVRNLESHVGERNATTAYQQLLRTVKGLPHYSSLTWVDSEFESDDVDEFQKVTKQARKEIKKLFGDGFTEHDYLYLQDQYDDLRSRVSIDTKSQEIYAVQICFSLLEIYKDRKANRDVSKKLAALDSLMNSANLQPKQNVDNASSDTLTFGQMIEKWENEKPIPEPSEEFKDVDNIGKYIRVWFSGWLGKVIGLHNAYTEECEEEIKKYTVSKPEYFEEETSDDIYDKIFGSDGE